MATVVNDLVTKFSFSGSTAPLTDYNATLGSSIKLLGGMIAGLNAAAGAFAFWADGVLKGVDSLDALSNQTGVSVAAIQELSYVAIQSQSSADSMKGSIKSLSETIGQAAQLGNDDFSRLGISVRDATGHVKSADKVLLEVGNRFKALHLSMAEQTHFAASLGIDPSLLQMLGKTSGEIANLRDRAKELGVLTKAQTTQAKDYAKSVDSMWFSLNSFSQLIAVGVAPEMGRMADAFTELLVENKDWVVNGVKFAVKWGGIMLESLNRMLPVLAIASVAFIGMKIATLGWAGAMGLLLSPVVLTIAAITAAYLVVDDLMTAFKGGKSVIADFYGSMTGRDFVGDMTKGFQVVTDAVSVLFDALSEVWGIWTKLVDGMISNGAEIAKFFGISGKDTTQPKINHHDGLPNADGTISQAPVNLPMSMLPNADGSQSNDNRQVIQNNTISIRTNDAKGTAREVDSVLNRQLDNANTQFAVGGL